MKKLIFLVFLLAGVAIAQEKPRVFVQGKGSEDVQSSGSGGGGRHWGAWGSRSTIDSHDEGMEVTKDLQKNCTGVTVTLSQSAADYTIMLNRESKKNRGLLRTNSQVQVANRLGDVLGTSATRTVGNAAKDACELIVADWTQHGPMTSPNGSDSGSCGESRSRRSGIHAEDHVVGTVAGRGAGFACSCRRSGGQQHGESGQCCEKAAATQSLPGFGQGQSQHRLQVSSVP